MKANASPKGTPSRRSRTAKSKLAFDRSSSLARSPPAFAGDSKKMRCRAEGLSGIRRSFHFGRRRYHKPVFRIMRNEIQFVETFGDPGPLEPLERAGHSRYRNLRDSGPLQVPADGVLEGRL